MMDERSLLHKLNIMLGTLLDGRYRIISQLGRGYYGETYLAQDTRRMERQCVVKRLQAASQDSITLREVERLFEFEAKTLEKLGRENDQIPDLLDYFKANGEFYLVQEVVEGYPLSAVLSDRQRLPESEVVNILLDVLGILSFIHQRQVIHRDIKPSNLMRRYKDGKIVLIDFGAVKQVHLQVLGKTLTRVIGTPGYMPSEQARGKPCFSSDIYALGMTAIQALTGITPSELQENSRGEVIWHEYAQVNPDLAIILDKMVRSYVGDRYQSADEVLHDLQNLHGSEDFNNTRVRLLPPKRPKQQFIKLKNILLASAILLSCLLLTQVYGFIRYGVFPAQPQAVIRSLPSSIFLQRAFTGNSTDVHPVPVSLTGNNFANFNSVAITPDGQKFAIGTGDGVIKLRNLNTGKLLRLLTGHSGHVHSIAISPDGQSLASGGGDGTIKLWNLNTGNLIRTLTGNLYHVNSVAISPNGQAIASGSSNETIKLWNLKTGKLLDNLTGHSGDVNSVAISPDGQTLASGGSDETIKLWNLKTGKLIRTLTGAENVFSIAISPNGHLASGSSDGTIKLWNLNTGMIRTLIGHSSVVTSVAISRDGKTLASNSSNQTIKLWNLETGQLLRTLIGYFTEDSEYINSVAFTPNGQTLVSATGNGTINLWSIPQL